MNFETLNMAEVLPKGLSDRCASVQYALQLQGGVVQTQEELVDQYKEHTGLKSDSTVRRHINEAVKYGFIFREHYTEGKIKKCKYHL